MSVANSVKLSKHSIANTLTVLRSSQITSTIDILWIFFKLHAYFFILHQPMAKVHNNCMSENHGIASLANDSSLRAYQFITHTLPKMGKFTQRRVWHHPSLNPTTSTATSEKTWPIHIHIHHCTNTDNKGCFCPVGPNATKECSEAEKRHQQSSQPFSMKVFALRTNSSNRNPLSQLDSNEAGQDLWLPDNIDPHTHQTQSAHSYCKTEELNKVAGGFTSNYFR